MRRLNIRGQSTLEYVIIWTAIVVGILVAANNFFFKEETKSGVVYEAIEQAKDKINTEVANLKEGLGTTTTKEYKR